MPVSFSAFIAPGSFEQSRCNVVVMVGFVVAVVVVVTVEVEVDVHRAISVACVRAPAMHLPRVLLQPQAASGFSQVPSSMHESWHACPHE